MPHRKERTMETTRLDMRMTPADKQLLETIMKYTGLTTYAAAIRWALRTAAKAAEETAPQVLKQGTQPPDGYELPEPRPRGKPSKLVD
jgi:hypothetical protein